MKVYFLQEKPDRKKRRTLNEGIPFRSVKRMFDYIETEKIDIGITRLTFYHYYNKYEQIPVQGVVIYENEQCKIKQFEI
jgi:hypothetical protein